MEITVSRLTRHLQEADESYLQHARQALGFALRLGLAACFCLLHALLPFLFERRGSELVRQLYEEMMARRSADVPAARQAANEPESRASRRAA